MKRTTAFVLTLAMLLSLGACGAQMQQPKEPAAAEEPAVAEEPAATEVPAATDEPAGEIKTLAAPVYPTERRWKEPTHGSDGFTARSIPVMLASLNGENRVYSPLNIYMALGMLAEITDGESRGQLLKLLGSADVESLRAGVRTLWETEYREADEWMDLTVLPAASVWLRDGTEYKPEALQHLADDYYAAAFSGPMGDASYDRMLRDWINERTNHLLERQAEQLSLDTDTVIALVTTLYFKGGWGEKFNEGATRQDLFHAENGDVEADFMRQSLTMEYFRGEHFGAVCLSMGGAGMWLLLPDEDCSLQELIDGGEAADFLSGRRDWADAKEYIVHLSLPKFDVSVDLSLIEALQTLGVTDVFDPAVSDFSPLSDKVLMVTQAQHAARVKIDEEGCEAAAFTMIAVAEGAAYFEEQPPEIDFVCDRPFLFAVSGRDSILFLGAICDPTAG